MNRWFRIMTNKGWRVFPSTIASPYLQQIQAGDQPHEVADRAFIDMPGMIMADRTYQTIELEDLTLEIPTTDFSIMYEQLKHAGEEFLPGGSSVFKLRGWLCGLVLTLELRNLLLQKMSEVLPAVKIISQKENEEFVRRLDIVNKNSPVKVISARALMVKQKKDEDKEKPN